MWQFKKIDGRGKFVVASGRKVTAKGSKRLKCGRRKLFYKSLVKRMEMMITELPDVDRRGQMLSFFKSFNGPKKCCEGFFTKVFKRLYNFIPLVTSVSIPLVTSVPSGPLS
jgi:hypothetical protein